jgi:hypothetical protein
MKKWLAVMLISLASTQFAFADGAANIKIKIAGAIHDNSYFLCIPNIGCLSILAAKKGKAYPVLHAVEMNTIFVKDTHTMRDHNQGLPSSCNVTVKENLSITIYGTLEAKGTEKVQLKNLHCVVS